MKDDELPEDVRESMRTRPPGIVATIVVFMMFIGALVYAGKCNGWLAP